MNNKIWCLLLSIYSFLPVCAQRTVTDLNFGWRFHLGDAENAEAVAFDDSNWRKIDVPHDFQIEQPWVSPDASERPDNTDVAANIRSRLSSRAFKEMGRGWYRLHLTPDASLRDKRLVLQFDGIMMTGDVYLNGKRIGGTDYGYVGFEIDVTNAINWEQENILAVMADTRDPLNSRWYTGGGLFRSVRLIATDKELFFERHPLRITTRDNKFVNISAEFTTRGRQREAKMVVSIDDPNGQTVYHDTVPVSRTTPSRTTEFPLPEIAIPNAQLWNLDTPNLYTAKIEILRTDGTVADAVCDRFGIRTIEIGPAFGMKLNGKKVLLQGMANHHSLGALGAAAYPRAIEKRLKLLKQFGVNHIRTSHNPYSREFIELCDECGILVVDELYDKWTQQHTGGRIPFEQLWQQDVVEWVKRDRNSPSVVLWSFGNELQQDPNQPFNDFGVTMYKLMKTLLNRYDSTRLTTVAMHPRYRNWQTDSLPCELAKATDIQAYNYRYMYFPGDGAKFPWMTFYQSEASVAAMGPNFFEMELDKVIGLAYWGGIDYLGESQGWPNKGWANGVFDISLEPKPRAYLMKSMFLEDEPLVHIAIIDKRGNQMWNGIQTGTDGMSEHWNRTAGERLQLLTYTNADEVELFVNGRSIGRQENPKNNPKARNQIRWNDVEYQPGKIEAVARTNGQIVARHKIETTGKAVRLIAEPDNSNWKADGIDLQHIRITAVDSKGRRVWNAQDNLTFSLQGDARIAAVSNGDIASDELNVQDHIHLWNGQALVILRAGQQPSKITLTTKSDQLKAAKTVMSTK
ncbi:MAG: DUF4982 domain-containing protein [Prevotella sp.]|nr:DUF4982 domain-containing protein [Prevotella sp.]